MAPEDLSFHRRETLPVSELFLAHQGEGPFAGVSSLFIRLQGCPVQCSWCDTPETWRPGEIAPARQMSSYDLLTEFDTMTPTHQRIRNVVVTGGEPSLFYAGSHARTFWRFVNVARIMAGRDCAVEIETSGLPRNWKPPAVSGIEDWPMAKGLKDRLFVRWSPKLPSAGAHAVANTQTRLTDMVTALSCPGRGVTPKIVLKFAAANEADVVAIHERLDSDPGLKKLDLWVMPVASTREALAGHWSATLQEIALEMGWN